MKNIIAATLTTLLIGLGFYQVNLDTASDFERWTLKYGKIYYGNEKIYRQTIYYQNKQMIYQHNKRNDITYQMAENQFMTITNEEFIRLYLNTKSFEQLNDQDKVKRNNIHQSSEPINKENKKRSIDWRGLVNGNFMVLVYFLIAVLVLAIQIIMHQLLVMIHQIFGLFKHLLELVGENLDVQDQLQEILVVFQMMVTMCNCIIDLSQNHQAQNKNFTQSPNINHFNKKGLSKQNQIHKKDNLNSVLNAFLNYLSSDQVFSIYYHNKQLYLINILRINLFIKLNVQFCIKLIIMSLSILILELQQYTFESFNIIALFKLI
ncbi:unnamed protein product [Paramecium pentaurelia]|uniref:Cathepsin propeptide inhibitor domain-containing protein n=1 Tax=Paramecium pentaurelia TaxID=43138 RepID=A0A8S1TXD3_9CILI|nr:unnamed protein product [Paramecium pentaurelia]